MKTVALVPLRAGSKGIPGKNIKPIAGKPLCAWVLEALAASQSVSDVYVSTDSGEIAKVVEDLKLKVGIIYRPDRLATDTTSTEEVMLHFAETVDFDVLVTAQATSPLTQTCDVDSAIERMMFWQFDSMLSGVRTKKFLWTMIENSWFPVNYSVQNRPRRQDWNGNLVENGAFYLTRRDVLLQERCRLGGRIGIYEMPADTLTEIDTQQDFDAVEKLLLEREGA
jgi:N-acylneuraminate cytidylyltransferase